MRNERAVGRFVAKQVQYEETHGSDGDHRWTMLFNLMFEITHERHGGVRHWDVPGLRTTTDFREAVEAWAEGE